MHYPVMLGPFFLAEVPVSTQHDTGTGMGIKYRRTRQISTERCQMWKLLDLVAAAAIVAESHVLV